MRLFGSDKLMSMFNALGVPENEQIEHKMLSSAIEKAQQKIETNNYGIRENLLKYDESTTSSVRSYMLSAVRYSTVRTCVS